MNARAVNLFSQGLHGNRRTQITCLGIFYPGVCSIFAMTSHHHIIIYLSDIRICYDGHHLPSYLSFHPPMADIQ